MGRDLAVVGRIRRNGDPLAGVLEDGAGGVSGIGAFGGDLEADVGPHPQYLTPHHGGGVCGTNGVAAARHQSRFLFKRFVEGEELVLPQGPPQMVRQNFRGPDPAGMEGLIPPPPQIS